LVEDDESVRELTAIVLARAGFEVDGVGDGAAAVDLAAATAYDLIVLDVMLPTLNGFDVCRAIRQRSAVPILMLTARTDTADIVAGLEIGADDYLTKPFEAAELTARARAAVRRATASPEPRWTARDLELDEDAFRLSRGEEEVALTATEFRLLVALASNPGTVMTRTALLEAVWGYDYLGDSRLVDMAVRRLRVKMGEPPAPPVYITTVRSVGYRFERG